MLRVLGNKLWNVLLLMAVIAGAVYALHDYFASFMLYNWLVPESITEGIIQSLESVIDPVFVMLLMKISLGLEITLIPVVWLIVKTRCSPCWGAGAMCVSCCVSQCIKTMLTRGLSIYGAALGLHDFTFSLHNMYTVTIIWFLLKNTYEYGGNEVTVAKWRNVLDLLAFQFVLFQISYWLYDWSAMKFMLMSSMTFAFCCMITDQDANQPACNAIKKILCLDMDIKQIFLFCFHSQLGGVLIYFLGCGLFAVFWWEPFAMLLDNLTSNPQTLQIQALLVKYVACQNWYAKVVRQTPGM